MGKSVWILAFAVLVLVGGLDAAGILPLGIFGGPEGDGPSEVMDVGGGEAGDGAVLEGRGGNDEKTDGADGAPLQVEPLIPSEVRGTTRNGASIRGRAIRAATGQPLPGVRVELRRPASLFAYLRAEAKGRFDLLTAETGHDGRFAFLDVTPSDEYVVRATLEGHAVVSSDTLDLRGGEQEDLGDLELGPSGGLRGRVLDHTGEPVADVRVAITWQVKNQLGVIMADPATLPEIERETTTGTDGRYEVSGLEPGNKSIVVKAPLGAAEVARQVAVEAGVVSDAPDILLSGNGIIAGTVKYTDGSPVVGARVFAGPNQAAALRTVETDAEGEFRVEWLPEGKHVVGIFVPGLPTKLMMGQAVGTEGLEVVYKKPGGLEGTVLNQATGAAVSKFKIASVRTDEDDFQQKFISALVNKTLGARVFEAPDGRFTLSPMSAGVYTLTFTAPGYPALIKENVTIEAGETLSGVTFEMPPGHRVRGTVQDKSGAGLGSARIYVMHDPDELSKTGRALLKVIEDREPDARSGPSGAFELPHQAPGEIHLIATHPSGLPGLKRAVVVKKSDVDGVVLVLEPSGRITGQLLGEAGRAATNQQVYVLFADGTVFRDWVGRDDGRFEFDTLPVGHCVVRWMSVRDVRLYSKVITADDQEAKRAAYDDLRAEGGEHYVGAGQELKLTLRLPRRVLVKGQLHVGGAVPTRSAGVWFTIAEGAWGHWAKCDKDGWYEAELEVGAYHLYAVSTEGNWIKEDIEIPDQAQVTLNVTRD